MKVLVASSGTQDDSCDPVAAAASFPWPPGTGIRVITVANTPVPVVVDPIPVGVDFIDLQSKAKQAAKAIAAESVMKLRSRGLAAEPAVVEGDPATAIADYAKEWGADLIVVGSHDRSPVERLLLDSVSQGVVKHASCSVLVVKGSAAATLTAASRHQG